MIREIAEVPVEFNGQLFRSELVAEWARFLGLIGQSWQQDNHEDARGSAFAAGPHPYPHQWGALVTRGRRAATRMAAIAARQVRVEPLHL